MELKSPVEFTLEGLLIMMFFIDSISKRVCSFFVKLFDVLLKIQNLLATEELVQIKVFAKEKSIL
jgi:hypothetical protein